MKICVGLSGGVDSSVAALLLKRQGYDVFAMFMQNWHDTEGTLHGDCEWEEDRMVAEMVAKKIGIPFHFVDLSDEYRRRVADYMFSEYEAGRTPNPDVLCNREIKFDAFMDEAVRLGADMVATGHYCRKDQFADAAGKTVYRILEGSDPGKDQSYFLCQLSQEQLSRALFPIGHLLKSQVREHAVEAGLPSAAKKDSQGICFVGKVDMSEFLKQKIKSVKGDVVEVFDAFYTENSHYRFMCDTLSSLTADGAEARMVTGYISEDKSTESLVSNNYSPEKLALLDDSGLAKLATPLKYDSIRFIAETYRSGRHRTKKTRWRANPWGKIIGEHEGAQFFTIGQRQGLNIGGHDGSLFVIATDPLTNIVYVGEGHTHKGLSMSCLKIEQSEEHWIRPDLAMPEGDIRRYHVRIRYRQPLQQAWLIKRSNGLFILFDEPQRGITPGQFAVWYTDEGEMLGSGPISQN
jgi:tRNA-specific 2-thiouridylase